MQIVDGRRAKSGIALSHHDVSKKDLDLGLSVH